MIDLRINGTVADIPTEANIALALVSPYWLWDSVPESAIQPPALPFTPNNQRIFGHWHEPTTDNTPPEYTWELYYGGELFRSGYFRLSEASREGGFSGTFTENLSKFFGEYTDNLLTELPLGTLPLASPASGIVQDSLTDAYALPHIENPTFFGTNPGGYSGMMNDGTPVPMFFVLYIIQRIAALTGVSISGAFLTDPTWASLILFNTRHAQDASGVVIAQHLPEMTVSAFFIELRKLACLAYTFDTRERSLKINFWVDSLTAPTTLDWTYKAIFGERKTPEANPRLTLGSEQEPNDALLKDKPALAADYTSPVFAGQIYTGIATVKCKFSTLLPSTTVPTAGCSQVGVSSTNNQLTNRFAPRVLFWGGVAANRPVATHQKNGISLFWSGQNGLASTVWGAFAAQRASQWYLRKAVMLTEADLATLDFGKKVHIEGVDYFVVQINVSLPIKAPADILFIRAE